MIGALIRVGTALWLSLGLLLRPLGGSTRRAAGTAPAPVWPASLLDGVAAPPVSPAEPGPGASAAKDQLSLLPASGNGGRRRGSKRLVMAASYAVSLAAIVALAGGATYGFFSATDSGQSNSFGAGTVTLTNDTSGDCAVSNLLPDGSLQTCTLEATYGGSAPAYMALDVLIETQHATGGTDLFNPSDPANDLQVAISSTSPTVAAYSVPAGANVVSCPAGAPAGSTCYELDDLLVNATAITSGTVTFTAELSLPTSSTTDYQGGAAQVILTAHAVQSANNAGIGSCTPGQPCTENWS